MRISYTLEEPPSSQSRDLHLLESKKASDPIRKNRKHPKDFSGQDSGDSSEASKKMVKTSLAGMENNAKAVPDPVPTTGGNPMSISTTWKLSRPAGSTLYILPPVSQVISAVQASQSLTPAPSSSTLRSTSAHPTSIVATTSSTTPSASSPAKSPFTNEASASKSAQRSFHFSSPLFIAMMAVGAACIFVGIVIVLKVCKRPKRRAYIVPSNPILQEDYSDGKFSNDSDESPLFGGKERFSTTHSAHASEFVPWTQYQSGIPKGVTNPTISGILPTVTTNYFPSHDEKEQYPIVTPNGTKSKAAIALQPLQSAVNRATSRLSAASMSIYPASPREDIGLALEGSYESEIGPTLTRSKSAPRNRSSTMNMGNRHSHGLAYNGVAISSPTLLSAAQSLPKIAVMPASSSGGRARVKSSYYAPGAYPRVSNMEPETGSRIEHAYPFDSAQDNLHSMAKSVIRRDRDTQALASALGFSSPIPPSPQPTLYPDDSLSMVGGYTSAKRSSVKIMPRVPAPRHRLNTPPVDTSATLGSLMLVDFGSGLPSLQSVKDGLGLDGDVTAKSRRTSNSHVKRSDDKPPRVPSPPPLPSLSQMGLQHANPEAYANYRSPTYSIYGLYNEADRKSKTTSFGF
ncbi:hypothetical protein HWV62_25629 [Athelia sp. TMB]|nr:hypothetical protein HWV62_25629 [Athelia sp. TMB]